MAQASRRARKFGEFYQAISNDIYKFAEACQMKPTQQQRQLFDAIMRALRGEGGRRIAVKSGQGPGKTTASGLVGLFLLIQDAYVKVITTAPTMRQCKDVWLAECKQTLRRADPQIQQLFNVTGTGIGVCGHKPSEWGCLLMTATRSENLQGQHRKDMHVIAEEASGIPRELIEQFKGTLSNPNAIFLQIGNPNTRDCVFFDCFNSQAHKWVTYTWNAEETPASEWFDPQRNADLEEEYGRDSDVYRIRVLGEFPHADPNCVMSSEDVLRVMNKDLLVPSVRAMNHIRQFGLDFARYGGDENVVFRRQGNALVEWWFASRIDPNRAVDRAFRMQSEAGWRDRQCVYVADAGGMGQGVMARFHDAGKRVIEFHNQGKPYAADYDNMITQAWFNMAKKVRTGHCYIPRDNLILKQLSTRQYFTNKKGRLILESKDDYMKRGHDSPDRADAAVLAMWDEVEVRSNIAVRGGNIVRPGVK
jgi:phage terminase large subunit